MDSEFLSASELGITAPERAALILTIEVLELQRTDFTMELACEPRIADGQDFAPTCGTAMCIGGTMGILLQNGLVLPDYITRSMESLAQDYVCDQEKTSVLWPLFYDNMRVTSRTLGIEAIRQFLIGNTRNPWLIDKEG